MVSKQRCNPMRLFSEHPQRDSYIRKTCKRWNGSVSIWITSGLFWKWKFQMQSRPHQPSHGQSLVQCGQTLVPDVFRCSSRRISVFHTSSGVSFMSEVPWVQEFIVKGIQKSSDLNVRQFAYQVVQVSSSPNSKQFKHQVVQTSSSL